MELKVNAQQYADRRGVTRQLVALRIRQGKIPAVKGPDGDWQIDPEAADQAWGRNRDPRQVSPIAEAIAGEGDGKAPLVSATAPAAQTAPAKGSIAAGQAELVSTKARLAQLTLAERQGELVPALEVKELWSAVATTVVNRLMLVPDKLPFEPEQRAIVAKEIRLALTALGADLVELAA